MFDVAATAGAVEIKAKGTWEILSEWSNVAPLNGPNDRFATLQRLRTQVEIISSNALKGVVFFEIGHQNWGEAKSGAALGNDGKEVKVRYSYVDWVIPQTDAKVRMGLQPFGVPTFAVPMAVLDTDGAGITVSGQFTENVGAALFWLRPYNEYSDRMTDGGNMHDAMDVVGLTVPLTFDGVKVTPFAMYSMIGRDTHFGGGANNSNGVAAGLLPAGAGAHWGAKLDDHGNAWWGGITAEMTLFDPFRVAADFAYGSVDMGNSGNFDMKRSGWYAALAGEYKLDYMTPALTFWYASGDDGNVKNGSERLPSIAGAGNFTSFMGDGNLAWGTGYNFYDNNLTYAGTWGVVLQIADVSFVEDLKHTFRVAYWGGTNSPSMVKYMGSAVAWDDTTAAQDGPYLTTNDGLLEFNLVNSWQIYENLEANLELGYIINMMDKDTWDKSYVSDRNWSKQDAWKAQLIFAYSF